MKPVARLERSSLVTALVLAGSVSLAGAAFAQYPQDQSKPTITPPPATAVTPPLANDPAGAKPASKGASEPSTKELMSAKAIIPSKAELPDAAFKKLDAGGKGYVTAEDTKELTGFEKSFQVADANHDGKLDAAEFKKAWASYTGRKSG